jgi:phage FluMu protein Com
MKPEEASSSVFSGPSIDNDTQVHFQQVAACQDPVPEPADDLLRCVCGALLARWVAAGLELKCRRCKRTTLIPYPKRTAITRRHPT